MNRRARLIAAIGFAAMAVAPAGIAGGYEIERFSVDAGGGLASGGAYTINGTIGQADADPLQPSTGGVFGVAGGFWTALDGQSATDALFGDGFE